MIAERVVGSASAMLSAVVKSNVVEAQPTKCSSGAAYPVGRLNAERRTRPINCRTSELSFFEAVSVGLVIAGSESSVRGDDEPDNFVVGVPISICLLSFVFETPAAASSSSFLFLFLVFFFVCTNAFDGNNCKRIPLTLLQLQNVALSKNGGLGRGNPIERVF
jgi:hypothetical protein